MNFQQEYLKCYRDKAGIYFIENYLSTFNADERRDVPFKLFPRQKVYLQSLVDNNNTIAIKHRQCGVTTVSSAWITRQIVFASKSSPETVLCIGNKLDISQQLVEKIGAFLDQVPRWMWGPEFYSADPDSAKNKKSIYKTRNQQKIELFNGCKIYARSSGEHAARGISAVSILIFDEAAFIQNSISVYSQAVAATASVQNAKIIMVSTPNGKDQLYYNTYRKALAQENNYHPVEFKWFQDLRYNRHLSWSKRNEETGDIEIQCEPIIGKRGEVEYNEERWRQLERDGWIPTSPWYEDMCKSFNNDEQKIAQELNVSFLGSSNNVIQPEVIEAQLNKNVIEIDDKWPLYDPYVDETWIWKEPVVDDPTRNIKGHRYICAVDCSSGSSEDRTAIEIIDADAVDEYGNPCYEQVLEFYGRKTGDEIGEIVFRYAATYNNALVVFDGIGGYSDAAILQLMRLNYPNLYYDDPGLKTYTVEKAYKTFNINEGERLPGFRTNSMRVQMFSNFVTLIKENAYKIRSTRLIGELETWVFKNGRPDHMSGCHDDAIYATAMGLFVLQYSMLRGDMSREKTVAMIKSWMVNGPRSISKPEQPNFSGNVKFSIKYPEKNYNNFSPFETKTQQDKRHMQGCILLGGFGRKSVNNSSNDTLNKVLPNSVIQRRKR